MKVDRVRIFDTTLRDGEQAARINLNTAEKIQIAKQLEKLKMDVIEASIKAYMNAVNRIFQLSWARGINLQGYYAKSS
jgi:2-isopropylmalate synthase